MNNEIAQIAKAQILGLKLLYELVCPSIRHILTDSVTGLILFFFLTYSSIIHPLTEYRKYLF